MIMRKKDNDYKGNKNLDETKTKTVKSSELDRVGPVNTRPSTD